MERKRDSEHARARDTECVHVRARYSERVCVFSKERKKERVGTCVHASRCLSRFTRALSIRCLQPHAYVYVFTDVFIAAIQIEEFFGINTYTPDPLMAGAM